MCDLNNITMFVNLFLTDEIQSDSGFVMSFKFSTCKVLVKEVSKFFT